MRNNKISFNLTIPVHWHALLVAVAVTLFYFPSAAHAYVDPSTGGYIFQLIFPIVSAVAAFFLFFKNQVKRVVDVLFRGNRRSKND